MPLWTLADFAAHEFPFPSFYVDPLITPDSTTVVFGPREAGKTQFVLTLFRALQEGGLLLGHFPCRPVRAVLVQVDMPSVQMQKRVQAALAQFPYSAAFGIYDAAALNIMDASETTPWVKDIGAFKPEIVVFDSLRKIHTLSEIDTAAPSLVYGRARRLFPDAARVFLHHVTKPPGKVEKGATVRDAEDSFRGTSAWLDDADTGLLLNRYRRKRTFQVTRGRHAEDDLKDLVMPIQLSDNGLFVELAEPTPITELIGWHQEHPEGSRNAAVTWISERYPRKTDRTYRRWCQHAGIGLEGADMAKCPDTR